MVTEISNNVLLTDRVNEMMAERLIEYSQAAERKNFGVMFGVEEVSDLTGYGASFIYKKLTKPNEQRKGIVMLRPIDNVMSRKLVFSCKRVAEFSVKLDLINEGVDPEDIEDVFIRR